MYSQTQLENMTVPMVLVNVVATATLDRRLDLQMVCDLLPSAYRAKGGLQMVVVKWFPTFLVFESGKIVCNGASSIEDAHIGVKALVAGLTKAIGECKLMEFKVVNLVASCKMGFSVNRYELQKEGFWLDDRFTGVTYWYDDKVRVICFHTGSVFMTGLRSIEQIDTVWNFVCPLICKHKM